jgi:hypothetical protein
MFQFQDVEAEFEALVWRDCLDLPSTQPPKQRRMFRVSESSPAAPLTMNEVGLHKIYFRNRTKPSVVTTIYIYIYIKLLSWGWIPFRLCVCDLYTNLRKLFLPEDTYVNPAIEKFNVLMATTDPETTKNLAIYINESFKLRTRYCCWDVLLLYVALLLFMLPVLLHWVVCMIVPITYYIDVPEAVRLYNTEINLLFYILNYSK